MKNCLTSAKINPGTKCTPRQEEAMCVAGNKAGRGQLPIPLEPRDSRHGTIGFDVFSMGFCSCFGPTFP